LSTIGSGVPGVVQGQAPTRGKAGIGGADASQEGGFASAIASLTGREGDPGRKGARLSISAQGGEAQPGGEHADEGRVKLGGRNAAAFADAFGKHGADKQEDGKHLDEKAAALLEAPGRQGRKLQDAVRDGRATAGDPEKQASEDMETGKAAAGTDVGNLLEMLAAPGVAAQAAGAKAGAVQDGKTQAGAKGSGRIEARTDAVAGKGDASPISAADQAGDVPASDTDRLFRLVRADGKGRDLDMSLSDKGDRASLRDANPAGLKGETVTVVDARRYIGLAPSGNAAAVTSTITQDPQWSASLSATGGLHPSEAAATGKVVNTLKIQMHPIELGLVTATLRLHGDELVVSLQVETGEAYRQLVDDQDAIVRALRGQGFAVDQVSVQLAPADKSTNAQHGDSQGQQQQFSGQPQAREGGNGRQGGAGQDTSHFAREGTSHEGNTSELAGGLAGGQSQRSGGVYL